MGKSENSKELQYITISMVLGLVVGLVFYNMGWMHLADYLKPLGDIFIRLLKMVIVPLIFSSIFMSMINLGSPASLGSMGKKAISYYFVTTALAVFIGIIMVNLIEPGVGASLNSAGLEKLNTHMAEKVSEQKGLFMTIVGVVVDSVPSNPVGAMAGAKVLQIILFSIALGLVALYNPKVSEPVVKVVGSLEEMCLALTRGIMKFAPIGIFALMVMVMSKSGLTALTSLSKYISAVLIGLFVHGLVLLTVITTLLKRSPFSILKSLSTPLLTALSTSSSVATLPLTMKAVEDNIGVKKDTAKFVLPLGATINMDGTALYESVAAIFVAQAYGIDLSIGQQVIIFATASLAAVGAAGIPGAGLITMSIVLTAVGLPLEGIGLILAVDRFLDMFRTMINVFGDSVGTVVVDTWLKKKKK